MKCLKCGNNNTRDSLYCNQCGTMLISKTEIEIKDKNLEDITQVIKDDNEAEQPELNISDSNEINSTENSEELISDSKKNTKKRKKLLIAVVTIALVLVIVVIFIYNLTPAVKYSKAIANMNRKIYEDAIVTFQEIYNYKDSSDKIIECKYNLAVQYKINNEYQNAIDILKEIRNYENSNDLLIECIYFMAKDCYKNGDFQVAVELFNEIIDYKDSAQCIENMKILEPVQGKWVDLEENTSGLEIIGDTMNYIFASGEGFSAKLEVIDNEIICGIDNHQRLYIQNEKMILKTNFDSGNVDIAEYEKGDISNVIVKENSPKVIPPAIGMTEDEVRKSTWGNPTDINRTTTVYGTREQWVYSDNRYIYLDNGIVTAIQE